MNFRTLLVASALVAAWACSSEKPKDTSAPAPAQALAENAARAPAVAAAPVTLLVTGDNWGEIAPCG